MQQTKFIIKLSTEISIKSKPVRKRTIRLLWNNIRKFLQDKVEKFEVITFWDRVDLIIWADFDKKDIVKTLQNIFWIAYFLEVIEYDFVSLEDIFLKTKEFYLKKIEGSSFAVRVNRVWNHNFNSMEAERYIWWWLLKFSKNATVNLKNPDFTINIDIKDNKFFIVKERYCWQWGYPTRFQDRVISLISGGFDSGVATYLSMKRWCKVDFLFFNLWGSAHELWVKQVAYYLWNNFSKPYKANFITVPFEELIKELLTKINHKYRGVLLKRCMLKVASMLENRGYYALIKWDSLGQVSSQTLVNMSVIDKASSMLVLRPLIMFDKQEIIDISKKIWTYNFAINMPEYCWVVSDNPTTWAKLKNILEEEKLILEEVLTKAFNNRKVEKINEVLNFENIEWSNEVESCFLPKENEVIIDIREVEKIKKNPLKFKGIVILEIPFFEINSKFKELDQEKTYLFYCEKWTLSRLHALYLKEKWFKNIKIFRPLDSTWNCKI